MLSRTRSPQLQTTQMHVCKLENVLSENKEQENVSQKLCHKMDPFSDGVRVHFAVKAECCSLSSQPWLHNAHLQLRCAPRTDSPLISSSPSSPPYLARPPTPISSHWIPRIIPCLPVNLGTPPHVLAVALNFIRAASSYYREHFIDIITATCKPYAVISSNPSWSYKDHHHRCEDRLAKKHQPPRPRSPLSPPTHHKLERSESCLPLDLQQHHA